MRSSTLAACVLATLAFAPPARAQTAEQIVALNLEAKGGAEKLKSVSSVKITGRLSMQGGEAPMVVYAKRPNLLRQELNVPAGKAVTGFDGTTAWVIPPGGSVAREVTGPQAEGMRSSAEFDTPLLDYAAKGYKVALVGKEKVRDAEAHHLTLTRKDGKVEHYYIDTRSGLELKRAAEVDAGAGKQMLESELSNYKSVDGMMIPHSVKQTVNGAPVMEMTIDKLEFNTAVDNGLFRMPGK